MTGMERKKIFWPVIFRLCDNLIDCLRNKKFTDVVAISRGGWIPAQILAYALDIRRAHSIGFSSYEKEETQSVNVCLYQGIEFDEFLGTDILLVDEVCDTGQTMALAHECVQSKLIVKGNGRVTSCALWLKMGSSFTPDYYGQLVPKDLWLVMPYDKEH